MARYASHDGCDTQLWSEDDSEHTANGASWTGRVLPMGAPESRWGDLFGGAGGITSAGCGVLARPCAKSEGLANTSSSAFLCRLTRWASRSSRALTPARVGVRGHDRVRERRRWTLT